MMVSDWSTSLLGHPAHTVASVAVVAASHVAAFDALLVMQQLGCLGGWVQASDMVSTLVRGPEGAWSYVLLQNLHDRVLRTEGAVGGRLRFIAAQPGSPEPPAQDALAWASAQGALWLEVHDNDHALFAVGEQLDPLLLWFLEQAPLEPSAGSSLESHTRAALVQGLFAQGWTRNRSLVKPGRAAQVILWGGLHERSVLWDVRGNSVKHVDQGLRLRRDSGCWSGQVLDGPCPLDARSGRPLGPLVC